MSYWDSSALVKLYVQELDSAEFRELAVKTSRVATGSLKHVRARPSSSRPKVGPESLIAWYFGDRRSRRRNCLLGPKESANPLHPPLRVTEAIRSHG